MSLHGTLSPILYCLTQVLTKAARRVIRDFGEIEHLQVRAKGPSDFVSQADRNAEEVIIRTLQQSHPEYSIFAEESGFLQGEPDMPTFIIDPIDGTNNFVHGLPHFCLAIAVRDEYGLHASAIFDPLRQEMFTAEYGKGAWLNNRRISVSGRSSLNESLLAIGLNPKSVYGKPADFERFSQAATQAQAMSAGVRRMGSTSLDLAYVACGRVDAFWQAHTELWDAAPGALLVLEAGGIVHDFNNKMPRFDSATSLFAAQPNLGTRLFSFLKRSYIDTQPQD